MPKSPTIATFAALSLALTACESKPLAPLSVEVNEAVAGAGGGSEVSPAGVKQVVLNDARISSDQGADDFQHAVAGVDFGDEPVARAALYVELRSPCFPFAGWEDLGVPAGQRWPAPCDAFDRTIQVTLDDPEDPSTGALPLELIRAISPFGGPEHLEADVTDVVNGLPGKHRLAVHIDTWSDAEGLVSGSQGEWYASATLETWAGPAPRRVLAIIPVAFEKQTDLKGAIARFEVPYDAKNPILDARLEYRATGHGGVPTFSTHCRGPAEEFCRHTHQLELNGETLAEIDPWRDDCDTLCTVTANDGKYGPKSYCAENPCGDPNSVRAPRANWCPGSVSPPFVMRSGLLNRTGNQQFSHRIPDFIEGGQWTISATYFAFGVPE